MKWLHLSVVVLLLFGGHTLGQEDQKTASEQASSEISKLLDLPLPSPKVIEPNSSPARQRPQQGPGWGGLISGKNTAKYIRYRRSSPHSALSNSAFPALVSFRF